MVTSTDNRAEVDVAISELLDPFGSILSSIPPGAKVPPKSW